MAREFSEAVKNYGRRIAGFARDFRYSMREEMPNPELLVQAWPNEKPSSLLSLQTPNSDLYKH